MRDSTPRPAPHDLEIVQQARRNTAKAHFGTGTAPTRWALPGYDPVAEIHRGGQGVVYQAVQRSTGQLVAVKLLRHGAVSSAGELARLHREIQVLGQLRHPNIVTIHDSGESDGLPYIVMDYIDGLPLDRYVTEAHLTRTQTLELFITVAEAVNTAHQRGIIHRDLKPANVLVDWEGRPIVLDFGLAKVDTDDSRDATLTASGQFLGSLPWAAPEQASGRSSAIDIRTDVYALGVILFQLLSGEFPIDTQGPVGEALERITTTAPRRLTSARFVINDELETIATKALQKEPDRRFQTAGELAADVSRFLNAEPILARPPSMAYLLRKHFQRHRALAVSLVVALTAVVSGGIAATVGMFWALNEREHAVTQQHRAERVVEFMNSILEGANPAIARGRDATIVLEMLDDAVQRLEEDELADAPLARLEMLTTISKTFNHLAKFDRAEKVANTALALIDKSDEQATRWKVAALQHKCYAVMQRDWLEAEIIANEAVTLARDALPEDDVFRYEALEVLGILQMQKEQWEDSLSTLEEVHEGKARILGPHHPDTLTTLMNMGKPMGAIDGRLEESAGILEEALEGLDASVGREHPLFASVLGHLGDKYQRLGDVDRAERMYREAIEINTRVRGPEHRHTLIMRTILAKLWRDHGQPEAFEQEYRELIPILHRVLGHTHTTAMADFHLAQFLSEQERYDEALPFFWASYEGWIALTSENHEYTIRALGTIARTQSASGDQQAASDTYDTVIRLLDSNPQVPAPIVAAELSHAALCKKNVGEFELAVDLLERAFVVSWQHSDGQSPITDRIADNIAKVYDSHHTATPDPQLKIKAECWRDGPCRTNPDALSESE